MKLSEQTPELFTMLVFYRGLHCPACRKSPQQLDDLIESYKEQLTAISSYEGKRGGPMVYGLKIDSCPNSADGDSRPLECLVRFNRPAVNT